MPEDGLQFGDSGAPRPEVTNKRTAHTDQLTKFIYLTQQFSCIQIHHQLDKNLHKGILQGVLLTRKKKKHQFDQRPLDLIQCISKIQQTSCLHCAFVQPSPSLFLTFHISLYLSGWGNVSHEKHHTEPYESRLTFPEVERGCLLSLYQEPESHRKFIENLCYSKSAVHFTCACFKSCEHSQRMGR